ncbi:23S rRNA (guanosine(2251)-2'-O)-methyltransferase RlmB [Methylopila jiangsuensis]|uniref:23S rRNA (Guanosine(2251)-2'-O)-methyltransferase RlmB n=1 Tax=Methylopila jiangsuensis TaxID=586230 RepID=A0A9W6JFL3_9HYPH|nr:RNA methyltransferase [Methylopila jiangsuensis]MDR6285618.1 23S rRNA (guanosine2251-2'-O)-methyltransferase [Methylopila jiangsuensis]GLK75378.1 23S rRNA (guanosine(2251)-2'-O)-methyltransferase RlmB [Methylopila jiangsuensis]
MRPPRPPKPSDRSGDAPWSARDGGKGRAWRARDGGAKSGAKPGPRAFPRDHDGPVTLYGFHSVVEALSNPKRKILKLMATENALARLAEAGVPTRVEPEVVRPGAIDRLLTADAVHQGLYLEAEALKIPTLKTIPEDSLVLVLDQITDPHNVGAIVRTAAAFAVDAIVTTARHSPEATGVLAKSASGGLEHVPLVLVQNLARALDDLGERGFRRIGLDSEGPETLDDTPLGQGGVALVLGAEGKGLRQLTRQTCDALARLDMPGAIKSLNVSNAAAIALHCVRREKPVSAAAQAG